MFSKAVGWFVSVCVKTVILFVLISAMPGHFAYMGSSGLLLGFVLGWMFVSSFIVPIVGLVTIPLKILTLGLFSFLLNILLFFVFIWTLSFIGFSVLTPLGFVVMFILFAVTFNK